MSLQPLPQSRGNVLDHVGSSEVTGPDGNASHSESEYPLLVAIRRLDSFSSHNCRWRLLLMRTTSFS
jgi:hypothetical protein